MLVLAAVLRLWMIHDVSGNAFYDSAVRSMGTSWHDFFFGALEPGGTVSIDKPPLDLWLQVAATRVLGFNLVGLHLPEALGGVAACGLLFGALRRPFGLAPAVLAALALTVLPASVLTSRSDTMDSVLASLEIGALWLSWRALESGRMRWSMLSAMVMGVAFNVKLGEMLIALPALALLWLCAAAPGSRIRVVLATAGTFLVVALSWTAIASLTPTNRAAVPDRFRQREHLACDARLQRPGSPFQPRRYRDGRRRSRPAAFAERRSQPVLDLDRDRCCWPPRCSECWH